MKYRYFMINQIFNYSPDIECIDFFATAGNYFNPNVTMQQMEYASDYKIMFEKLMDELTDGSKGIKASPGGQIYEVEKYDLLFITLNGRTIGNSSWTKGADGIVWTINLNGKSKSIPVKNWSDIFTFIKDNI